MYVLEIQYCLNFSYEKQLITHSEWSWNIRCLSAHNAHYANGTFSSSRNL